MKLIVRLKCYARGNEYYKEYFRPCLNEIKSIFLKYKYYIKYYSFRKDKEIEGNTLYFIIDSSLKHGGLTDRFKGIVGCYYIAKINGFDFKIIYETPFHLNDYLDVNEHNWLAERGDLSYSVRNSRIIQYKGKKIPPPPQ
jgi:hypothetical protein